MSMFRNLGRLEVGVTSKVARFMSRSVIPKRAFKKDTETSLPQPSFENIRSTQQPPNRQTSIGDAAMDINKMTQSLQQVSIATEPSSSWTAINVAPSQIPGLTLLAKHQLPPKDQLIPSKSSTTSTPKLKKAGGSPASPPKRDAAGRSVKVLPSKASGGVPEPSASYLRGCQIAPIELKDPQELLVVIDLNGTLLYRPNRKNPTKFLGRPNADLFLKYCIDNFSVVIWSSAKPANVNAMCDTILTPELRQKVVAIWGRDKFNLSPTDFVLRVQCYKRLTSIWKDPSIAASHPLHQFGGRWDQTNTVLIDDSLDKARSEPYNLIEVPDWTGDLEDYALPHVHDYLNHLSRHSNVSGCLYSEPFKPSNRP